MTCFDNLPAERRALSQPLYLPEKVVTTFDEAWAMSGAPESQHLYLPEKVVTYHMAKHYQRHF